MRRRDFIAGAVVIPTTWPLAARALQGGRIRRLGILMGANPDRNRWLSEFTRSLAKFGWMEGRNLRTDIRDANNIDQFSKFAKELVDLQPDVIVGSTTPAVAALQRETKAIPIVFVLVSDPIGFGFVAGLPRPGGNITGFMQMEASMAGKWVELLTQIRPGVERVMAIYNPELAPYVESYYLPQFETAARSFKLTPVSAPVHSDAEIERVLTSLGREPGGGLVVMPDVFVAAHDAVIISLAAQKSVPTIWWDNSFVRHGGLLSYGPDIADEYRRSASYVDRILRGAKPSDLPVQLPVKFEMALNAKTARALGLTVPPSILVRAEEVIE
jgi:putative tryptophan/tyrosine transport system substrate-binding protein